jgi:hypothetical protein
MTTTTTYPNGQQLVSSALTQQQISAIIQQLTYGMIGLAVPPPNSFQPVQVDWQTQGQPFMAAPSPALSTSKSGVDECYISCVTQDDDYTKIRNRTYSGSGPVLETWVYSRSWRIAWVLYGPNATDRARMIWSAMFIDYFNDQLSLSNLYPVTEFQEPTRIPELINAQWYDRADFSINCMEQVTETISDGAVTSVEVKVYADDLGQVADFTVVKP